MIFVFLIFMLLSLHRVSSLSVCLQKNPQISCTIPPVWKGEEEHPVCVAHIQGPAGQQDAGVVEGTQQRHGLEGAEHSADEQQPPAAEPAEQLWEKEGGGQLEGPHHKHGQAQVGIGAAPAGDDVDQEVGQGEAPPSGSAAPRPASG